MSLFFALGAGASLLVGAYALFGLVRQQLFVNGATALLLVSLAFAATAGGEFVREGVRKPFSIRHLLYSNSIKEDEVAKLRERGCTTDDPYPLRNPEQYPNPQVAKGAHVYRNLCSVCHTVHGTNALTDLTNTWSADQMRINISKLQRTKPFMPPFAGNAEEVEALVQFLRWESQGRPADWQPTADPDVIAQIDTWLAEAGTQSGLALLDRRLKE
jgi:cytochrome c1